MSKCNLISDETGGNSGCSNNSQTLPRGRPTTVSLSPSSNSGNPRAWEEFRSLLNRSAIEEVQPDLRLDGIKVSTKNAPERAARVPASSTCRHLDGGVEEQPLESTAEESPSSFRSASSLWSPVATGGEHYPKRYAGTMLEDHADPHGREDNNSDTQRELAMRTTTDRSSNVTNAIEGASDNSQLRLSSTQGTCSSDAMISGLARSIPFDPPGNKDITPPGVTSSERGPVPVSDRGDICYGANGQVVPDLEVIGASNESDLEGSGQVDTRPSIGDRASLGLILPQPGKGRGTRHKEG